MKILQYKCTLLTDLIINQKSATTGSNKTLDFIPGNIFLGIAASKLYMDDKLDKLDLFHRKCVRFGDAHIGKDKIRSLRTPLSYYKVKNEKSETVFVHHLYDSDVEPEPKTLKQQRSGFLLFTDNKAEKLNIVKRFSIKSAYDRDNRRSKDESLFGYESLPAGLEYYFEVEVDKEELVGPINDSLIGIKRAGRSKTAEFGQIRIEKYSFKNVTSASGKGGHTTVYADGRLIFIDEYGMPAFRPTARQLGFSDNAEIDWEKSQIRTFQYSPWNTKRAAFDMDRCGIEKGSVFVVRTNEDKDGSAYIGSYNNEGFGKVIYNPNFLNAEEGENGRSNIRIIEVDPEAAAHDGTVAGKESMLISLIRERKRKEEKDNDIYQSVNQFVKTYAGRFKGAAFASQWGAIRSIASVSKESEVIDNINYYINHGIKKDDWKLRGRSTVLNQFMKDNILKDNICEALVNLSSEMAKKISK